MDLTSWTFVMPGANAALHVTSENTATGAFQGNLFDGNSDLNIPVSGKLTLLAGKVDAVTFAGVASGLNEIEIVKFNGKLQEQWHPLLTGKLDEEAIQLDWLGLHVDEAIYDVTCLSRFEPKPPPLPTWPYIPLVGLFGGAGASHAQGFAFSPDGAPQQHHGSFSPGDDWLPLDFAFSPDGAPQQHGMP
jgi:hypothetical protein